MSIFISIASYRDPELIRTIKSAIDNATNPNSVYFGVVIQDLDKEIPDLSFVKNIKVTKMHPRDARGAGYARHKAMELYDNQDYYMQVDSHTVFCKGWDDLCISEHNKAKVISKNNKVILSYFPPPYHVESNNTISFPTKDKERLPYPTKQFPVLNKRKDWTAKRVEFDNKAMDNPEESSTVLAGFIFTTGEIVKEVPYDPEISFFGEEICFAIRSWTRGWDIYSPSKIIVHHFYGRGNYKKIWKDKNFRRASWIEIEANSKERQKSILCGMEKGIFGAGTVRSIEEYQEKYNINFKNIYGLTN